MALTPKTAQLQIRVSPLQKAALKRAAARAGLDVSAYVLGRVQAPAAQEVADVVSRIAQDTSRFAMAELNALLTRLTVGELREAVEYAPRQLLDAYHSNYIAAMVEMACERLSLAVPAWVCQMPLLAEPVFGSTLQSLRLYLLTHSPAAFRRRNIFIDASIGGQV
jgi:uncharacterized protein (DUF1778 family)